MQKKKYRFGMMFALCCALLLSWCAMAQAEMQPLSYYQTAAANDDPSKPYVELGPYENPVHWMYFSDASSMGWHYGFSIRETNGIPFTLTAFTETFYSADGLVLSYDRMEEPESIFDTVRLADGQWLEYGTRMDLPTDVRWAAYEVEGVDDAGNAASFHCLIQLVEQEKPVQKLADFQVDQQPEAGRPFAAVSIEPAVVYAAEAEDGQFWWEYTLVVENTGDAPLNVTALNEVCFNGEDTLVDGFYQASDVIGWCGETDTVLDVGERWVFDFGMPVQELTAYCVRLIGTDAQGSEMSFVDMSELSHEMKSE